MYNSLNSNLKVELVVSQNRDYVDYFYYFCNDRNNPLLFACR